MPLNLTAPIPPLWQSPKGTKGSVKLRQAFMDAPPTAVGWGQDEDEDEKKQDGQQDGPKEDPKPKDEPYFQDWRKGRVGPIQVPVFGWGDDEDYTSANYREDRFPDLANVHPNVGFMPPALQQPWMTAPQPPQQMPWDRFREWATSAGPQVQKFVQGIPENNPLASGIQALNVVGKLTGQQGNIPTPTEAAQQGTITPGQAVAADITGGVVAGGPEGIAAPVAGGYNLAKAGVKALGQAVENPRSVPGIVARAPMAFAMGAAGGGRAPRVNRSEQYAAQQAASQVPLDQALRKSLEMVQQGVRGGTPTTAADVEALQAATSPAKKVANEAKASALADLETATKPKRPRSPRAKAEPVAGDNDQGTIQSWDQMVQGIDAKRDAEAIQNAQKVGVDITPAKKARAKPPSGTIPPLTKAALGSAGDLPPGESESVMRGLWNLFAQPSSVPGVALGTTQAKNDWDQHAKDNLAARTWSALVAGAIGFDMGASLGHVAFGGPAKGMGKRASNLMVAHLFGPATVAKKVLGDVGNLAAAIPTQRYLSTVLDGRPRDVIPAIKAGWAGFGPALVKAGSVADVAFNPTEIRSVQKGFEGLGTSITEEVPSAGQFTGTLYTRGMQYATDFAKTLTEERAAAQNAYETQQEMSRWLNKATPDAITKWLSETVTEDGAEIDRMSSEAFQAGLPGDAVLRIMQDSVGGFKEGSYGYEMAKAMYAREKADVWAAEHLLTPEEWAKRATFTNDPTGIAGKVTQIILKAPGDIAQGLVDVARGTTKGDKLAREFPAAIQRLFSPVSRIPSNLVDEFIARVPGLGLANAAPVLAKGTRAEKNIVLAKQIEGAMELAGGWALANYVVGPNVNGQGPVNDPKKYKEWLADGNQPWSIRWPDGRWRPIHEIPHPAAQTMARAIATVGDHAKFGTPYDVGALATDLGSSIANSSYFPTLLDAARAMQTYQYTKQWSSALGSFGWDMVTGLARAVPSQNERMLATSGRPTQPAIFGQGTPPQESVRREVATGFPETTGTVPDRRTPTGQPYPNFQQGAYAPMGAMAGSQPLNDPVLQFFMENKVAPNLASKSIEYGVGPDRKPMTLPLSGDQQQAYTFVNVDTLRQQIALLEKDQRWQGATPQQRQAFISDPRKGLLEYARKKAQKAVIQQMVQQAGGPQAFLNRMQPAEREKFKQWAQRQA